MKRFLAFSCEQYYPGGGWNDFEGSFDTLEEAKASGACQVVDSQVGEVVWGDKG